MHHGRGLRQLLRDDALAEAIEADFETAGLSPARLAMLRYAAKLTTAPATMEPQDLEPLRAAGFGDAEILAIAEATAYYAYANRIADGLGVELE